MKLTWAMKLPEAWRLLRICWQPKRLAAVAGVSLFVSLLIVVFAAVLNNEGNKTNEQFLLRQKQSCEYHIASKDKTIPEFCKDLPDQFKPEPFPYALLCAIMLGLQGALWIVAAPVTVGMSVYSEFDKDTWPLQQTTPQSSRKLLLGKMLGAPGDIYIISSLNLPFVFALAFRGHIPLLNIVQIFLLCLILFALISSLLSYVLFMTGKTKHTPTSLGLLIGSVLFITYLLYFGFSDSFYPNNDDYSFLRIQPGAVFVIKTNTSKGLVDSDPTPSALQSSNQYVRFFDKKFPVFPFAVIFYLIVTTWFFFAADSELRRKTSMPSGRYHLFALFALVELLFVGFTIKHIQPHDRWDTQFLATAYNTVVVFLSYFVIFSQVRTTGELRPWIYRTAVRRRKLRDFFSDDAPPVYSIIVILLIILCGIFAIPVNTERHILTPLFRYLIQAGFLSVIILRDVLFFQIAKMCHKRGLILGLMFYLLIFIAVPGLAFLVFQDPFDLSPLSSIISILAMPSNKVILAGKEYIAAYMLTNGALAILFFIIHARLITAARRKFQPAAAPAPAK